MLDRHARGATTRLFTPVARALLRAGVSPDAVTVAGTVGVSAAALVLYPMDQLFWGTIVITLFVFSDLVDGIMAREAGASGPWGSFLDSTLDRIQDAAIFLALSWWGFGAGQTPAVGVLAGVCLALGMLVSYARAKAESLGLTASVGVAERAERLVLTLVFAGLTGLGLPTAVLTTVLALLAVASLVTVLQRVAAVRRQTRPAA
ncbi:phosphatidylinositol phosphate synthase [Micrococcus lacusdianchii]|uniref:phosphatidylinositol phosphate synthase n=1 Tax=Micrococcus lacusdianchii TaxID=2915940 RepID=UPI0020051BE1|nr:CDP-alcohol phosphatidyltransferase family protein [Micrococcus sp. JXJ CY 30]